MSMTSIGILRKELQKLKWNIWIPYKLNLYGDSVIFPQKIEKQIYMQVSLIFATLSF
jgi:hypothetical protein